MKKYSVLMSVYINDNCKYLKQSIESMLSQTIKPDQFVIVEDGRLKEDCENLIKEYEKLYPDMINVIRLKENGGLANALNVGMKSCRNDLIARMDADDISIKNRCEEELKMFEKYENLAVCGCNIDEFSESTEDIKLSRVVPSDYEEIIRFSKKRQPFNHPTVMMKKSIVEKCGGYIKLRRNEDFDLFSRIITSGYYVRNVNKSLYLYRADESNYKRRKSKENMKSAIYVYKRHWKRKGCSLLDFLIISSAEIFFWIIPDNLMEKISNKVLREQAK